MSEAARDGATRARSWQIACAICAGLVLTLAAGYIWPLRGELRDLQRQQAELEARDRATSAALDASRTELGRSQQRLAQLEDDARGREAASMEVRRRLEKLERVLSTQFGRLARADMLLVSSAGDRLSIALAIPALFQLGRTQVTGNGRALLCELAQTIMQHHDGQIRVSGYYGKPALAEAVARYGTPWQLSAARAASAAGVLERDCKVPAERFYAVGYGPRAPGPLGENVALELILSQRD